jgi:hypothetical protein
MTTNEEVLQLITRDTSHEGVKDSHRDILIDRIDEIYTTSSGKLSPARLEILMSNPQLTGGTPELIQFLEEFRRADPNLTYWFCWIPYRYYLTSVWPQHVEIHNAKVEREYSEDRWKGLKI